MGFFSKLLGKSVNCPACGHPYARETFSGVQCVQPDCAHYDPRYVRYAVDSGRIDWKDLPPAKLEDPVEVDYVNFAGTRKTFTIDRQSMRVRGRHLSVRVSPSGFRIALDPERIQNLADLQHTQEENP